MPNDEMYADSALALAAPPTGAPIPEQFLDDQRVAQGAITIATPVTAPLPPLPEAPAVRPRVKHGVEARGVGRGRGDVAVTAAGVGLGLAVAALDVGVARTVRPARVASAGPGAEDRRDEAQHHGQEGAKGGGRGRAGGRALDRR